VLWANFELIVPRSFPCFRKLPVTINLPVVAWAGAKYSVTVALKAPLLVTGLGPLSRRPAEAGSLLPLRYRREAPELLSQPLVEGRAGDLGKVALRMGEAHLELITGREHAHRAPVDPHIDRLIL
jgi:hypothetical protein